MEEQLRLFTDEHKKGKLHIAEKFSPEAFVTLHLGDRLELLRQIAEAGSKAELKNRAPLSIQ